MEIITPTYVTEFTEELYEYFLKHSHTNSFPSYSDVGLRIGIYVRVNKDQTVDLIHTGFYAK